MEPQGFWGTQPPPRTPFPWDGGSGVFNAQIWGGEGTVFTLLLAKLLEIVQ